MVGKRLGVWLRVKVLRETEWEKEREKEGEGLMALVAVQVSEAVDEGLREREREALAEVERVRLWLGVREGLGVAEGRVCVGVRGTDGLGLRDVDAVGGVELRVSEREGLRLGLRDWDTEREAVPVQNGVREAVPEGVVVRLRLRTETEGVGVGDAVVLCVALELRLQDGDGEAEGEWVVVEEHVWVVEPVEDKEGERVEEWAPEREGLEGLREWLHDIV